MLDIPRRAVLGVRAKGLRQRISSSFQMGDIRQAGSLAGRLSSIYTRIANTHPEGSTGQQLNHMLGVVTHEMDDSLALVFGHEPNRTREALGILERVARNYIGELTNRARDNLGYLCVMVSDYLPRFI